MSAGAVAGIVIGAVVVVAAIAAALFFFVPKPAGQDIPSS
jgi:hypothetical protein